MIKSHKKTLANIRIFLKYSYLPRLKCFYVNTIETLVQEGLRFLEIQFESEFGGGFPNRFKV